MLYFSISLLYIMYAFNCVGSTELLKPMETNLVSSHMFNNFLNVKMFKGCFKLFSESDTVPEYEILFDGLRCNSDQDGFFTIPLEERQINRFYLLICNKIQCSFDKKNTIKTFSVESDKKYKFYEFNRSTEANGEWAWREQSLQPYNFVIPRLCIVVRLNPLYFSHLESWDMVTMPSYVIKLPRIVLKADDEKDLKIASKKSLFNGFNDKPFHTHNKDMVRINVENGVKVKIAVPGNNQA